MHTEVVTLFVQQHVCSAGETLNAAGNSCGDMERANPIPVGSNSSLGPFSHT
jgi:hypothetical protein